MPTWVAYSAPRPLARVAPHLPFGEFFFYCSCPAHRRGASERIYLFLRIDPCRSHITFVYYRVTGHPTYVLRCELYRHGLIDPTHGREARIAGRIVPKMSYCAPPRGVLPPTPYAACRGAAYCPQVSREVDSLPPIPNAYQSMIILCHY